LSDFFDGLTVRWCAGGVGYSEAGRCGIGSGHVYFTGQQLTNGFFRGWLLGYDRNSPFRGRFWTSSGLAQWNHEGFPFGAREDVPGSSLHLSFTDPARGPVVIEAHIDRYGNLFDHLLNEVFGEGVPFSQIWQALQNEGATGAILRSLLDCPPPPGGGHPR